MVGQKIVGKISSGGSKKAAGSGGWVVVVSGSRGHNQCWVQKMSMQK